MSLYGPLSWFCKLISSFRRLWTAVETRSWRDFGKSLETVVCLLLLSNGGPLSLVCLKVATMKKSASFWCDLFPEWLENDRWRRFQSSLDRITSCLTSGSAESLGGKYLPGATLTSAPGCPLYCWPFCRWPWCWLAMGLGVPESWLGLSHLISLSFQAGPLWWHPKWHPSSSSSLQRVFFERHLAG